MSPSGDLHSPRRLGVRLAAVALLAVGTLAPSVIRGGVAAAASTPSTQTVNFDGTIADETYVGTTWIVRARATIDGTGDAGTVPVITVDPSSSSVCSYTPYQPQPGDVPAPGVGAGSVTTMAAGTCTLDAAAPEQLNQATGDSVAAASASFSFTVDPDQPQLMHFLTTPPSPATVGNAYLVSAGATNAGGDPGQPADLSIDPTSTPGACSEVTIDRSGDGLARTNGVVSFLAPGTCVIDATAPAAGGLLAAAGSQSVTISAGGGQTVSFGDTLSGPQYVGSGHLFTAATSIDGTQQIGSDPQISVDPGSFPGTCFIDSVGSDEAGHIYGDVSFLTPGTCIVDVKAPEYTDPTTNVTYPAATATQVITVVNHTQTVTFDSTPPPFSVAGDYYYVSAQSNQDGLDGPAANKPKLSIDIFSTTGACDEVDSIVGPSGGGVGGLIGNLLGTVEFLAPGTCIIDATAPASDGFDARTVQQIVTITNPLSQTVKFQTTPANPAVAGGTYDLKVVSTVDGTTLAGSVPDVSVSPGSMGSCDYTSTTSGSGGAGGTENGTVRFLDGGTCTLLASAPAISNPGTGIEQVAAGETTQSFTVVDRQQKVSFLSTPPSPARVGGSYAVAVQSAADSPPGAIGNTPELSVDASSTPGACSLVPTVAATDGPNQAEGVVSFLAPGSCVVRASSSSSTGLASSQAFQSFVIGSNQQVTFLDTPPDPGYVGTTFNVEATSVSGGGAAGNAPVFAVDPASTPGACTVVNAPLTTTGIGDGTVTLTAAGACVLDANAPAGGGLAAGSANQSVPVSALRSNTIMFLALPPDSGRPGGSYLPLAIASSGLPVSYSVDTATTAGTCSLTGGTLTFHAPGDCILDATSAAGNGFAAGQASLSINVVSGVAPTAIAVSGGSGQTAKPGSFFSKPLSAKVNGSRGTVVPGVTVTFRVTSGSAAFTTTKTATATTNANGIATAPALIAGAPGAVSVSATVNGVSRPALFSETVAAPRADAFVKIAEPGTAVHGGTLTVTITTGNNGPAVATGIRCSYTLPVGFTVLDSAGATRTGQTLSWNIASLASGTSIPKVVRLRIPSTTRGSAHSSATATTTTIDPAPANNTATATTVVR